MSKYARLFLASIPFILAALALALSIAATASRDWAHRHHYDPSLDMKQWKSPIYTTYRSPFIICTPSSASSGNTTTNTLTCNSYRPHGFGKTSCELVFATQDYNNAATGDERLCQQVHYAGNLAIASCVFIGTGFLLVLGMTIRSFIALFRPSHSNIQSQATDGVQSDELITPPSSHAHPDHRSHIAPWVNLILIILLSFGAVLYLLSQFFGVLGLIQSQPDNGIFAAYAGNNPDPTVDNSHGPWIQGKGITRFATLAWLCSALAAAAAAAVWRVPRMRSVL